MLRAANSVVVPLRFVGHGAGATLLQRQARLGAVERLNLGLLVDRQHDGVGRRVDIKAGDRAQLRHEIGIVGELEVVDAVRRQAMRPPDALNRGDADPGRRGHGHSCPMGGLVRRLGGGERDHFVDHLLAEWLDPRGAGLVAQQAVDAPLSEAFLPAPDAGLGLACPTHDLDGAEAVGREEHDGRPPNLLLRRVTVTDDRLKPAAIASLQRDRNPRAHAQDSHAPNSVGIPCRIHPSDLVH